VYLWRRSATERWWRDNELALRGAAQEQLAIIERPSRKRLQLELAAKSRARLQSIAKQFGGRIQKLPRDWLKRSLQQKTKPIKVGKRKLKIPAGAAFGTGEHATTAMSLRLLQRIAPDLDSPWSVVDLGTGSGILALAAKILGARRVVGIDNDPIAIRTAKQNARANKIRGVQFRVGDVRNWKSADEADIVTANLFSELLIEIMPKLKAARWLILSGFLRNQESEIRRVLTRNKIDIIEARRRGKWVAILARRR
jgi:ribosomal protein L11 methyltransferase